MFVHNLKIAFRNMRKYKNQTLISIVGLAVGFTCFALATLWIRYEMTFDVFHKNAQQMYVVFIPNDTQTGNSKRTNRALAGYLKETFPEIANATTLGSWTQSVNIEGVEISSHVSHVDTSFIRMFDVKVLEGSLDFLISGERKIAVSSRKARQLYGNENPVGKTVALNDHEYTISAVVSEMSKKSNYSYDFIFPHRIAVSGVNPWHWIGFHTIIELHSETNVAAFEKKLYEHRPENEGSFIKNMTIIPLTKLRYVDPERELTREVKFQHIIILAVSGLLVVLCSLFNYFTLFVSRFRIRQKELALRMVCGASTGSLFMMLSVEFVITLMFAVVAGCMFTRLFYEPFLTLAEIEMNLSAIYFKSFVYIGGVIILSLILFWLILVIFRYRSLNISIRRSNKKMFRKASVVVQLVISIGFAFCSTIILKQIHFLHHADELGFSFKNRASINLYGVNNELFASWLKQIPEIIEVVDAKSIEPLLPQNHRSSWEVELRDDARPSLGKIRLDAGYILPEYADFYDFQLISGEWLTHADDEYTVLINETVAKTFGWNDPIGKQFEAHEKTYTIKGVIKNIYNFAPTISVNPAFYMKLSPIVDTTEIMMQIDGRWQIYKGRYVLFQYSEQTWQSCIEKIEQIKNENNFAIFEIYNAEEIFAGYLKSEKNLIKLLSFVSAICILICVFGFVSLVSLTCEERRKSIAIRKVNGATVGDILGMFAKEYFMLLFIGAAIAFPAGYLIMQRWLENYMIRTNIPAWLYLSIVCALALVIVICVGWQVYKSSVENPAEVVKSE